MTAADKLLAKMRENPRDWQIGQLETLARQRELGVRKSGGSHVVFSRAGCPLRVTVPAHKPIKPVYIAQFLELVDWDGGTE